VNLPANWSAFVEYTPPNNQGTAQNGFGKFDAVVDANSQANRLDPSLTFSIDNAFNSFDVIADYIAGSNPGSNGSSLFAIHIAGFTDQNPLDPGGTCTGTPDANNPDCNLLTSVWVGGGTVVPVPAAVWLFGSGLLGLWAAFRPPFFFLGTAAYAEISPFTGRSGNGEGRIPALQRQIPE
jgi:hypothetical protein